MFQAGIPFEDHLLRTQSSALPQLTASEIEEILDLMDASSLGGRIGTKAEENLSDMATEHLTSALLALVENRETENSLKQQAYSRLRDRGVPAMLPRLILRLKYEKDSWSAVCVADTLLRHSNGAGLNALIAVLEHEPETELEKAARVYAASSLAWLPETLDWSPGSSFDADWKRLLQAKRLWDSQRRLGENETKSNEIIKPVEAELWRMIAHLDSQRLRPVDDARFVLLRQRGDVIPILLQAAADPDRYVREHALQTLSWIGNPIGHWAKENEFEYVAAVLPSLADPLTRTRALEALGAAGIPTAADVIWSWIEKGSREEKSAASDALLRCADESILPRLRTLLGNNASLSLSPEARFSLYTLWFDLEPELEAEYPNTLLEKLAETEQKRRRIWSEERREKVAPIR